MRVKIEIVDNPEQEEVIIRCTEVDAKVRRINEFVAGQEGAGAKITFYKEGQEFYFPVEDVLFFETDAERVFAHTVTDSFWIRYRLYELEELLPPYFIRGSKSCIVNSKQIYSIKRNLTAASLVQFANTHKHVFVSRYYYQGLRQRMSERSQYEK